MTTARKNKDDRREYENVKNNSDGSLNVCDRDCGSPVIRKSVTVVEVDNTHFKKKNLHGRFGAASILFWFLNRKRKVCLDGLTAAGVLLDARMRLRGPCVPHNDLNEPAVRLQVPVYFILFSGL